MMRASFFPVPQYFFVFIQHCGAIGSTNHWADPAPDLHCSDICTPQGEFFGLLGGCLVALLVSLGVSWCHFL